MDNKTINTLQHIVSILNRTIPIPLLIFGTIGNLLNIFILTRASLQKNSCAFYFLALAFVNLGCLWFDLFARLLSGYRIDPTTWNSIVCKFRFYITYLSLYLSSFFLLYATIDRWASSSTNVGIRLFSKIEVARRIVLYTVIFALLFYLEIFYCYSTVEHLFRINCYCRNYACRVFNDIQFLVLYSLIPSILMLYFGYQKIRNVKRIHPTINQLRSMKKKDQQMMMMLRIQVIFFFVCITPSAVSKCYTALTYNINKDLLETTKENFFFQISVLLLYVHYSSAFYIYTLSGRKFRREVKRLIRTFHRSHSAATSPSTVTRPSHILMIYQRNQDNLVRQTISNRYAYANNSIETSR